MGAAGGRGGGLATEKVEHGFDALVVLGGDVAVAWGGRGGWGVEEDAVLKRRVRCWFGEGEGEGEGEGGGDDGGDRQDGGEGDHVVDIFLTLAFFLLWLWLWWLLLFLSW